MRRTSLPQVLVATLLLLHLASRAAAESALPPDQVFPQMPAHTPALPATQTSSEAAATGLVETASAAPPLPNSRGAVDDLELTGRDIYRRVLENRFKSYVQTSTLSSGDRSGNVQDTTFQLWYQDYQDDSSPPEIGTTLSKGVVKYTRPVEIRHTGYLVINKQGVLNDQFVYRPSSRRILRVNLRGESVFGSDFSLEDIIPKELEDSDYTRLEDSLEQGAPTWVIVLTPLPDFDSEYSKMQIYVEKQRAVPLRVRYWDDRGTEFKELLVPLEHIERREEVWIPMRMSMKNKKLQTYTHLVVDEMSAGIKIPRTNFDLRRLLMR
jgi:hypothetical protein